MIRPFELGSTNRPPQLQVGSTMMGGLIIDRSMIVLIVFPVRLRYCQVWQISNFCYCSVRFILLHLIVLLTQKHKFCIEMLLLLRFYLLFLRSVCFWLFFYFCCHVLLCKLPSGLLTSFVEFLLCILLVNSIQFVIDYFVPFCCFVIVLVSFSDSHCCVKLGIL